MDAESCGAIASGRRKAHWRTAVLSGIVVAITPGSLVALSAAAWGASPSNRSSQAGAAIAGVPNAVKIPHCAVGTSPGDAAYDPLNHLIYVPEHGGVAVIKSPCTVTHSISTPAGSLPSAAAFDASDNDIYVVDSALNQVYVISGTTIIATVTDPSLDWPAGIAYDPAATGVVVTNLDGDSITFIIGSGAVGSESVGTCPVGIAYSAYADSLIVANECDNDVSVLSATYFSTGFTIDTGSSPYAVAYDPANGLTYVTNEGSNNVPVVDPISHHDGDINVGNGPESIGFDQFHLRMYVTNSYGATISEISGFSVVKTVHLPTGSFPVGATFSDFNGKMYVPGYGSGAVYVVP
jgi:DNA-binding beta-propeller fold protein YncE